MSSFIGHGLAAAGILIADRKPPAYPLKIGWLAWLILLSWSPDIDYGIRALRVDGLRLSHSIGFCLILPMFTAAMLATLPIDAPRRRALSAQALAASLSHLLLDLLVGVTPLPLLWPFSLHPFHLPFGILPSAGDLSLTNPLLYRNTLIEIGVLLPVVLAVYVMRHQQSRRWLFLLLPISLIFALWAFSLSR